MKDYNDNNSTRGQSRNDKFKTATLHKTMQQFNPLDVQLSNDYVSLEALQGLAINPADKSKEKQHKRRSSIGAIIAASSTAQNNMASSPLTMSQ